MKKLLLASFLLLFGVHSMAESIKIKKLKGNQAIVEVDGNFEVGQTYQIAGDEMSMDGNDSGSSKSSGRKNLIGMSLDFYNYTTDPGGSTTGSTLAVTALYGWNKGNYEYGPSALLAMSGSSTTTTTFGVGGFFDYNFTKNRPGVKSIFSVGINGLYKSTSGGSTSTSTISLDPGVAWRYFAFNDTCLRFEGTYHYASQSGGVVTVTQTGPHITGWLVTYF